MKAPHTQRLIDRIGSRLHFIRIGTALHRAWLVAAGVLLLGLIGARLLGLYPAEPLVRWGWVAGVLAVAAALLLARRPTPREAARVLDERTESKELFLTAGTVFEPSGGYEPIVIEQAEERAQGIDPRKVAPFAWQRGLRDALAASALVAVAAWWLPQLDPFQKTEQRQQAAAKKEQLRKTIRATELRAEQIREEGQEESKRIEQALAALEKTFREAKPQEREANLKKLAEHQKEIGELWRKAANRERKDAFSQGAQRFGDVNPREVQEWREALKKGDASPIQKELKAIREQMEKLAAMPDGAEKRAEQQKLAQQMAALSEKLKQAGASPQMQAAMQRAMEQLDLSKADGLSQEAMKAAMESMNLSEQELQQLAEAMKGGQDLEDALKSLQMAKQLAEQQKLDGSQCSECKGMGDYAALYASLSKGGGSGLGMGLNPGQGAGGKAEENDESETGFKPDRPPTQLAAGRNLLEWKTQELGPTGSRPEEYREAIREVKKGVGEAIAAEQVPPGYHEAIQKYFDSLPEK
jgi:chemotaxis protein histidine kinase CheA